VTPFELSVDGAALEAAWHGEPARRALVFLHHGLGSARTWRDFPALLGQLTGLPAFAYSRLGHGHSAPATESRALDYVHREAWDVLPEVLRQAGITQPLLIGHSDGASIALLHASLKDSPAQAIVVEAPHIFIEERTLAGIRAAYEQFRHGDLLAGLERQHGANAAPLFRAWADTWLSPEFRPWNCEDRLPLIRCPTLLIQGVDDEFGTPFQVTRIRDQVAGPVELALLDGVRHEPHREQPDRILDLMAAFLTRFPSHGDSV
jgi:pimeloyl-ACP methyl ester carboxylesterase